jgi:hypothetical protein
VRGRGTVLALPLLALPLAAAEPLSYEVAPATVVPSVLLAGDEEAWAEVPRVQWGPDEYLTEFRAVWSQAGLSLRFDARDPDPWHTMTGHDEHLWDEEVVEIFLDLARSGRDYAEIEINPAGVICDVRMRQAWPDKQMDLAWDFSGLESSVSIRRDAGEQPVGWTAVIHLPWEGFGSLPSSEGVGLPPAPGDRWRFNLFRIERPGGKAAPEKDAVFAAWSPPGGESFHVPKAFRDLVFVAKE